MIGDYLFTDEDFINRLSTEKPGVFKKIYEEIKYLVKVATAGSKEAKQLEKVKRAFEKAYKQTDIKIDSGIRYSVSDIYSYDNLIKQEDVKLYTSAELGLETLNTSIDFSDKAAKKKLRKDAIGVARNNIKTYNQNSNERTLYNKALDETVLISNESLEHGMNNAENIYATINLPAYFENAIVINEADGVRNNADRAYVLIGGYKNGDSLDIVRMVVNEYDGVKTLDYSEKLYSVRKGKKDVLVESAGQDNSLQYLHNTSSSITVKELLDFVKENFPNELSADVSQKLGYTRGKSDIEGLRYSLSEENEVMTPRGSYNVYGKDLLYQALDEIGSRATSQETSDDMQSQPETELQDYTPNPEVYETEVTDADTLIDAKIENYKVELQRKIERKEDAHIYYNKEIARKQSILDKKKNKNTKAAQQLASQIERLKRKRDTSDAEFDKQINAIKERIDKMNSKEYRRTEQRKIKLAEIIKEISELIGDTSNWKDKKTGFGYKLHTLKRNLRDVVGDTKKADEIYRALQGRYNHNEALLNTESNKIKKEYADMHINKYEDQYIQMLGEYKYNPDTTLTAEVMDKFYSKYGSYP